MDCCSNCLGLAPNPIEVDGKIYCSWDCAFEDLYDESRALDYINWTDSNKDLVCEYISTILGYNVPNTNQDIVEWMWTGICCTILHDRGRIYISDELLAKWRQMTRDFVITMGKREFITFYADVIRNKGGWDW